MNHSDDTDTVKPPASDSAAAIQPAPSASASSAPLPNQQESQPEHPQPSEPAPTGRAVPARKPAVQTLPELVAVIYGKQRRQPKLNPKDLGSQSTPAPLPAEERSHLLSLALCDRTLDRTRMLLALGVERLQNTRLDGPVREFVRDVLASHPAFQGGALDDVLRGLPDGADEEAALRSLLARDFKALQWPFDAPALKKNEVKQCRANAVICLLLWLHQSRGTSPLSVLRAMDKALWSPAVPRTQRSERHAVTALAAGRDLKALAVACGLLEEQIREQKQSAATARDGEERATKRARRAEEELAAVHSQLKAVQGRVDALAQGLQTEREARAADAAHARDDYQRLRGSVLQRLKEDVSLLDEGLQAISRGTPKVHVMMDHAERVIQALRREMDRLREE